MATQHKKTEIAHLPSNDFWRYSLKLYSKSIVKDICLELQNTYSMNVNLVLLCCWLAVSSRGRIKVQELQRINKAIQPWEEAIILQLRQIRSLLSNFQHQEWPQQIRKEILADELVAEHIEQLLITHEYMSFVHKHRTTQQKIDDCINNLNQYFLFLQIKPSTELYLLLQKLIAELFPTVAEPISPQMVMQL